MLSGSRRSVKQAAKRLIKRIALSAAPNRRAPASELIIPPSNAPTTERPSGVELPGGRRGRHVGKEWAAKARNRLYDRPLVKGAALCTYQELATHYDTAILPTRPRKPRDKAKVEV